MQTNQRPIPERAEIERKKQKVIAAMLVNDRARRRNQIRYMSIHVGSRWYRAPEVSLVEK
jgi:hypothetical protein